VADGPDGPEQALLSFAESFAGPAAPRVALLTGGEPLLRPRLVRDLAERCRAAGTATFVLTGMFWARGGTAAPAVAAALAAVDHVSASLDAFHEREVPRRAVFAALRRLLDAGKDVSLHLVAGGPQDRYGAYVDALVPEVRREFGDRVPMLVGRLGAVGRGRELVAAAAAGPAPDPETEAGTGTASATGRIGGTPDRGSRDRALNGPARSEASGSGRDAAPCAMAAWPVVGVDGTVTACCNQEVLDRRPVPGHLALGNVAVDDWPAIRERGVRSPALRAVRTLGVRATGANAGCAACRTLPAVPDGREEAKAAAKVAALEAPVARLQELAGPAGFVRRYGSARYAGLVLLGLPEGPGRERGPLCNG
jgi:hypothetical protein